MKRTRLLFLCTGNSARSILAEAIANQLFGDRLAASSAGSQPKGEPNPMALETLRGHGLKTDWLTSKSWDVFRDQEFDLVISLCDSAAKETCPTFPGAPLQVHWGFPDPPASDDPKATFERVYEGLSTAVESFVHRTRDMSISDAAKRVAREVARQFPDAAMTTLRG